MQARRRVALGSTLLFMATTAFSAAAKDKGSEAKELNESTTVLSEIRNASDGIPDSAWKKTECVVVIPSLKKAGFIVAGEFGSGVMSCRQGNGWGAPVFMQLTKGSAGLQIGAQAIDLVLLIMNKGGAEKLLSNKVTLGADASIAAGPVGRAASAATDALLSAEMLSYSRTRGLFAGVDLSGGSLRPDTSTNNGVYGANASTRDIAFGITPVTMSAAAKAFTDALGRDVRATTGVKK